MGILTSETIGGISVFHLYEHQQKIKASVYMNMVEKGDSIYFPPNIDVYTLAAYYKGDGQRWDKRVGSIELY